MPKITVLLSDVTEWHQQHLASCMLLVTN